MIRAAAFTLLAACLALPARSQESPPVERTDAAARELAAEVKASPTRPDNLKERMDRLMHFAMASGRPQRYLDREKVHFVQKLAVSGRRKEAAKLADELYFTAASATRTEPEPPGQLKLNRLGARSSTDGGPRIVAASEPFVNSSFATRRTSSAATCSMPSSVSSRPD